MAWDSEIREAIYTTPSGKKFSFYYNSELSSSTDLKTASFTFPEKDGALVMSLGVGGRKFPMVCTFHGQECLSEADEFENALKERGVGELQHPIYGTHRVVPTGSIERKDDLVKSVYFSQISITFAETLDEKEVSESANLTQNILENSIQEFEEASTKEFAKDVVLESSKDVTNLQSKMKSAMQTMSENYKEITSKSKSVFAEVTAIEKEFQENVYKISELASDTVIDSALQLVKMVKLPAMTAVNFKLKLEGCRYIAESLIKSFTHDTANRTTARNDWAVAKLALTTAISTAASGIALASVGSGEIDSPAKNTSSEKGTTFILSTQKKEGNAASFTSREQAVNAAVELLSIYDKVEKFMESKVAENFSVDTGESFLKMKEVVIQSVGLIVNSSFDLPSRKIVILDRDRQIIEFLYEVYGNLEKMDEFILDNSITYNELEVIPMGRKVAFYV